MKKLLKLLALNLFGFSAYAQPVITEFMASNDETLQDEEGEYSDWIEIHNPGESSLSLAGWHLTDDLATPTKWQFPSLTLQPDSYLVVFASGEDRRALAGTLHTNFKLSSGGEYLGLIHPDGLTVSTEFSPEYPSQTEDISYGSTQPTMEGEVAHVGYFNTPTPGANNGGNEALLILDAVLFSRVSGPFVDSPELTLSGAASDQVIRYKAVNPSSTGAEFSNPTSEDPLYTQPIPLTQSVVIRAAIFSADGTRNGPMITHHFVQMDTSSIDRIDLFSSQLPLFVFDNHGFGPMFKDEIERPAWLYAFSPAAGEQTTITETPTWSSGLELEVRGQTSSGFPKKSYKFDLIDDLDLKVELEFPGLGNFNEWVIIGPWDYDRSYIRNAFVYDLSNSMGRWAPQTRLVEVFFNSDGDQLGIDDYAGVYVMTDSLEIEPGRLDLEELDKSDIDGDDVTGAYVLEFDEPDSDKYSWETENGYPGVETSLILIDTPKIDDIAPEQIQYIKSYVQSMEDALITGEDTDWINRSYLQYLDRASWIDFHLINTFVKNTDIFWRSVKLYKDRNRRIVAGPVWDYDRSIDSSDPRDNDPVVWDAEKFTSQGFAVEYWKIGWWGILNDDPEFMQGWFDRWSQLHADSFSFGQLSYRVDRLAAEIGNAAATRDTARWPTNVSEHGSFTAEIANMKAWLSRRADWINDQYINPPFLTEHPDGSTTVTPRVSSQLIYTLQGGDPRLKGGEIAPDALISTTQITFPAGSNFRVRAYDPNHDIWPGTKWSRALPGNIGSPYTPSPRLVNLSSRARVESGDNVLITGITINDADDKWILFRGIGPTLADFDIADPLIDPVLTVFDETGEVVAQNTGWDTGSDSDEISDAMEEVGAFPLTSGSGDTALLLKLPVGRYSVHLDSANGSGGTGLAESYEIDELGALINLSIRGLVNSASDPLIAGFVVSGTQPKRVLVRGVGPTLANFGVENALSDPILNIESAGQTVASNDNWQDDDQSLIEAANQLVGAFALDAESLDAAILITLPPGIYTAVVTGADDTPGPALVEVYEVE